jgi:hypothetical protein
MEAVDLLCSRKSVWTDTHADPVLPEGAHGVDQIFILWAVLSRRAHVRITGATLRQRGE